MRTVRSIRQDTINSQVKLKFYIMHKKYTNASECYAMCKGWIQVHKMLIYGYKSRAGSIKAYTLRDVYPIPKKFYGTT